jgi:hypothetical protein
VRVPALLLLLVSACVPRTAGPVVWVLDAYEPAPGEVLVEGQERAPCAYSWEVEWAGGCWSVHPEPPPCPTRTLEVGGRCLAPNAL